MSENVPVLREGFYLKITDYTYTYNILNPPNKIQSRRNKDFLCKCGYLWFKIHNQILPDQNDIMLLITKENY